MASQRVIVTYSAPPAFLATDQWKQLHAALSSQLPLRNLHWKSVSRPTIRTIQELQVDLVAAETLRDEHTSQVPQSILEKPLLNAYIVVCEDTDAYRASVKKQIKDWHTSVLQRKNQEWLIIHVVRPESKSTGARLFQVKATVLDKIRADFNVDKRDRCVQLVWASDYDNPAAWAELITKVKDGILAAFDTAVTQREEEIKRSEGQRQMPGWNFCTYFILKESLASSFEGMTLHDEALYVYDELEALFHQVLRDKNLSWFGALASPSAQDDSAPLLSVSKKPYRDLILANSISVFDFRVYLLAREALLLSRLGKVVDIARKAVAFLNTFGRRLREIQSELPPFFIESWTYSSALSVVEQCNAWAKSTELNKATQATFNAIKGELLELARHQLDILGIDVGFLPCQPPFSDALPKMRHKAEEDITPEKLDAISKKELRAALAEKEAFLEAYISLTNRAIERYANAGRRKFALRMHGSLAALDVVRGRLTNALTTYTSLPAHYSPHGWTSLEAFMLTRALDLNESVEKPHDKDWLLVLLDYLKAYVQDLGKALLITKEDHVAYTSSLAQELHKAAVALESDFTQPDHPALSIAIAQNDASLAGDKDGAVLQVKVKNSLPCDLPVDEISVVLTGRENDRLTFSKPLQSLPPGTSVISLFCPSATVGTYSLHSSQVKIGHLILQWLHAPPPVKSGKAKAPPVLVRIPRDLRALDVKLRQPQRVELGTPSRLIVALHTGRNEISKTMLRLSGPVDIKFHVDEASIEGDDEINFEKIDESLVLFDIAAETTVLISVPHTDASGFPSLRVSIVVDYSTTAEPNITRTVRLPRSISAALPLAINVEDFFRGTRLFTRFTLSTTSFQTVRIKKTELLSSQSDSDDLKITKGIVRQSGVITVTQDQPGKFLFQLDAKRGKVRDSLHLHITYRMLRDEVEAFIGDAVDAAISSIQSPSFHREELCDALIRALQTDAAWVEIYCNTGEVDVPSLPSEDGDFGKALLAANEILRRGRRPEDDDKNWREMVIPLDVPQMHILAAARLRILPNPFIHSDPSSSRERLPLYAGQPISAILTITTSFHWAPAEDADKQAYVMRFDVEEMTKDWLVSGRKRGDFVAKDGQTFETPVTLIALHHGELLLPKVAVHALPLEGQGRMRSMLVPSCETCQLHGAEKILVLPRGGRTTFVVNMGENTDSEGY